MNLLSLVILCLFFVSCNSSPKTTIFSGIAMTVPYRIVIGDSISQSETENISSIIHATFAEIDAIYNKWNPNSELSLLNQLTANTIVPISPKLERLLSFAEEVWVLSGGRFDPTIESIQQLWKNTLLEGKEPPQEAIDAILSSVGWNKIHFGDGLFYKENDSTSIDLGGIAKGLCVDMIVEHLAKAGYHNLLVDWGGELRSLGQHPDNRPWTISIRHLGNDIFLQDQAIATSGDYFQNWQIQDTIYFHVFDPKTGHPLTIHPNSIASASVLAPNCALADGLATAALLFPTIEEAEQWLTSMQKIFPSLQFWLATRDEHDSY